MNYENNNQNNNNMTGNIPNTQPGINNMYEGNNMNYGQPQPSPMSGQNPINPMNPVDPMNQMNSVNTMNTIAPGMGNLNNTDFAEPKSKKHLIPIIIAIVIFVLAFGGVVTYKTVMSSPKIIFKSAIKSAYKEVSNTLTEVDRIVENFDMKNKALTFGINASVDSNLVDKEELGFELKDLSIGAKVGLDANKKEASFTASYKGQKEEINAATYYTDEKVYATSNLLDNLIYMEGEELDIDFESINKQIDKLQEDMPEIKDIDYLIEATTNALAESLDSDDMSKEQTKMDVTKDNQNFTKYSYKITDKALKTLAKDTIDKLTDDKEFIRILSEITEMDEDKVKEELNKLKDSTDEIEYENKVVLNIYTKGFLNTFSGFNIEVENEEIINYVDDGKTFIITIGEDENKIEIKGEKDKERNITIEVEGEKVFEATIKDFSDEKIDVSFNVFEDGKNLIGGSVYLTKNEEKTKIDGDYKFRVDIEDKYLSVEGDYKFESNDSLEMPDTKKAVSTDTIDEEKVINKLKDKMANDEIINAMFEDAIEEMENEKNDLNTNGMKEIYSIDELQSYMALNKIKVLYVGTNYPYDDDEEKLFNSLVKVQKERDFYSYRLPDYYMSEVKALFPTIVPVCKPGTSPTCEEAPVIYFIQGNQAVSALAGAVTEEDIIAELNKITTPAVVNDL